MRYLLLSLIALAYIEFPVAINLTTRRWRAEQLSKNSPLTVKSPMLVRRVVVVRAGVREGVREEPPPKKKPEQVGVRLEKAPFRQRSFEGT